MSCIWHRFNLDPRKRERQCRGEWHCLVCFLRDCVLAIYWGVKYRVMKQ
jgi:hypothetical protein